MNRIVEGLYIHIPFCQSICTYCSFSKLLYNKKFVSSYLISLKNELDKYRNFTFKSIYIGGGTPNSLDNDELSFLFDMIAPYKNKETMITIEVNPDLTSQQIAIFRKYQVKRVSIGVQTFNQEILSLINRKSDFQQVSSLIKELIKNGIEDINLDLIYGFNDESLKILQNDLNLFTSLPIKHVSTYCLQIEKNTILSNKDYPELADEKASEQYNFIVNYLSKKGFFRYEVSNFAKKGFESKHNLIYWNNLEYIGIGLSAASYLDNIRRSNTKNLNKYLLQQYDDYEEILTEEDKEFYFIMLGLRKEEGISLDLYQQLFKKDFLVAYHDKLISLFKNEDLILQDKRIFINPKKMFIMDFILRKLLF